MIATEHETEAEQAVPIAPRPPVEAMEDPGEPPVADPWTVEGSESGA